jgi:SAM-dependent methyltransferase
MERFAGHYDEWTDNRLAWILRSFGDDVFKGRSVLDIGGGTGHIARRALDLGARSAEVVEGRLENIRAAEPREGLTFTHANLERGLTSAADAYDVVINFGVIYHVVNWEPMLIESVARARELVVIETEVVDAENEATRYVMEDRRLYDQALTGIGSRPSEFEIDRLLARVPNTRASKALDGSLNAGFHRYDWENRLEGMFAAGMRRFWSAVRTPARDSQAERREVDALLAEVHRDKSIDVLTIVRRTQDMAEHLLGRLQPPPGPPAGSRELAAVTARMAPLQAALDAEEGLDVLDRTRTLPGHAHPRSCTDEEGLALYETIAGGDLKSGLEIGTGFGYSTAYIAMAMERTGGHLVSMDCYVEELTGSEEYDDDELAAAAARLEGGEQPAGLAFAVEQLGALGLEDVLSLSLGVSPASLREALFGRRVDFAFIDTIYPLPDFEAIQPYLQERCAVFFRAGARGPSVVRAIAAAEDALGSGARPLPSRHGLTLVARGLEPASVDALGRHFLRARA